MNQQEFELGEFVIIPDIQTRGVIVEIKDIQTLDGKMDKRYSVVCQNGVFLLRKDQMKKDDSEINNNLTTQKDLNFNYFLNDFTNVKNNLANSQDIISYTFNPITIDSIFNSKKSNETEDEGIDLDSSISVNVEIELLDKLIDGSLDRGDKEEFVKLAKKKKDLLNKLNKDK